MKDKFSIIVAVIATITIISTAVFGSLWLDTEVEKNELRKELALATIVGQAYVDYEIIEALDQGDRPAVDLRIQLYRVMNGKEMLVEETVVDSEGKYIFCVAPGTYYVLPVHAVPGYPSWNWITHLRSPAGYIIAEESGTYLGPTFLVRESWGRG